MTPGDVKADNKGRSPRSTGVADVIASGVDAKAWFFVAGVLLVVIGARTFVFPPVETWQLIIKTTTMMTTLLLAALLQNTPKRVDDAVTGAHASRIRMQHLGQQPCRHA